MKHIFFISLLFFVLGLIAPNAQPHEQTEGFLIMFEPHVKADDVRSKNLFSIDGDLEIVEYFENVNIWWVKHNSQKITRESALQRLRAEPGIRYADPIRNRVTWRGTVPNDTHFSDQWGMRNNGQTGGTAGADISATKAWDITRGDSWGAHVPVVAVIDNGFEQDHPDLAFLTGGYNAYNDNFNVPVADHGTHVTGILGATSNNSSGVAGVMWNTEVFPVAGSSINETVVVRAYDYILGLRQDYNNSGGSSGRFIVATNSSFGINEGDPSDYGCWCAMYDAMGAVGIISVAATANRDWDIDQVGDVPTACNSNYLITVTNTTHLDNKYAHPDLDKGAAWGLNTIHLGAPGTNIKSTLTLASGSYGYDTGTSMATPHVTGVVGLIYSVLSSADIANSLTNPGSLALSVKDYILNNVDPIADLSGITTTGGRLNAYEAVKHALPNQLNSPFIAVWPSQDIGGSHIFGDSYLEFGTLIIPQGKAAVFSGTLTGFGGDYAKILVQGNMVVESGAQLLDLSVEVAPTGCGKNRN
ncbi:MAG: S8 family serine peptidase [Cyclonatronaceae bacterium]